MGDQNPGGGVVSGCVRPIGHTGRCRDRYGRTWDNNHPPLYQADAVAAVRTLVRCALDVDELSDADLDAQALAAETLRRLLEVTG